MTCYTCKCNQLSQWCYIIILINRNSRGNFPALTLKKVTGNQKVKFLFSIVRSRYMAHFIFDTFGAGYKTVWSERHKGAFVSKDIDKCTLKYDIKNDLRYLPSSLSLRCKSLVKKQTLSIYVVNINTKIKDMNYSFLA